MPIYPLPEDDDEDILSEAYEAKTKKSKKSISEIRGPNGEKLPEELQKALAEYIDTSREEAEAATPIEFRAIAGMIDQWAKMHDYQKPGAVMMAMCELLDDMTDGALSNLAQYHEARRRILYTRVTIRNIRIIMSIINPDDKARYMDELYEFLDIYLDYIYFIREGAIHDYRKLAELTGKEVDEGLIETGIITSRNYWERHVFGSPPAFEDE